MERVRLGVAKERKGNRIGSPQIFHQHDAPDPHSKIFELPVTTIYGDENVSNKR